MPCKRLEMHVQKQIQQLKDLGHIVVVRPSYV